MNIINQDIAEVIRTITKYFDKIEGKTFLITGANGFLPFYLCKTLLSLNEKHLEKPCKIIALVRNKEKSLKKFVQYINRNDFELIIQDVCIPILIDKKIDYIIHAASQASPKYYSVDPVGTLASNTIGTMNMLELAYKKKVQSFLYFSSSEVYGETGKIPTTEDDYGIVDPLDIRNCYSESKRMGENMCFSYFTQYNVPIKIVRPFHTYGPGMLLDDGRVFADFVKNIINSEDIVMKSDGKAIRTFCYLSDATEAFFTVLFEGTNGNAYNVSNDKCSISILELANMLVSLFPEKKLKVIQGENLNNQYMQSKISISSPDINKIKKLGWLPHTKINEGFRRTVISFNP